jgi:hypothetical protein
LDRTVTDGEATDAAAPDNERTPTAPDSFCITVRGFGDEATARKLGNTVGAIVRELSRHIDLGGLDGITVAGDYADALAELDRGYATTHVLTPSDGDAIGIAMTPSVLREGTLKSHIVVNAHVMAPLLELGAGLDAIALHTLAHECGHVQATSAFEHCFPGYLLRTRIDALSNYRWQVTLACWDEYAATYTATPWGEDPTDAYEQTFLTLLAHARERANEQVKAYRLHADVDRVIAEVFGTYGDLMKFAAYHLGNLAGRGLTLADRPATTSALEGHWFKPYFDRLAECCATLLEGFGEWGDQAGFEAIGDLAEDVLRDGGLFITRQASGGFYVDIPFTPETMP